MLALITSIQHCTGNPSQCNRQEKEIKGIKTGKEKAKVLLFVYPKGSSELIREFHIFAGYKVNIQRSIVFLYMSSKQLERGNLKKCIYNSIKYLEIDLEKDMQDLYSQHYKAVLQ